MTDEILFQENNGWGVITLNRPKALNALTFTMVEAFLDQLKKWEENDAIRAVMVTGAGDRAFCAGGDIRWLHDTAKNDPAGAAEFFRVEYTNNARIFHFKKPYVALIDGIVMGGGVGVSVHGDYRVAGDNTLFAMPETGIGLFPDVGGGHFMPRLSDGFGLYYALTGARAKAADCVATGIATHYTPTDKQQVFKDALLDIGFSDNPDGDVKSVLDAHHVAVTDAPIEENRQEISGIFKSAASLNGVMEKLESASTPFAQSTLKSLARMSPTSLAITFEQMKRGANADFDAAMKMEFRVVRRVMEGHDFFEGVRAQIIDKDKTPKWSPASLGDIGDVDGYFEELGSAELQLP